MLFRPGKRYWFWSSGSSSIDTNKQLQFVKYCKTLIFSELFNLAKLAIEIKTLKIKAAKIK